MVKWMLYLWLMLGIYFEKGVWQDQFENFKVFVQCLLYILNLYFNPMEWIAPYTLYVWSSILGKYGRVRSIFLGFPTCPLENYLTLIWKYCIPAQHWIIHPLMLGFLKNFRIKETSYFGLFENFQRTKAFHEMICKNWWFRICPFTQF